MPNPTLSNTTNTSVWDNKWNVSPYWKPSDRAMSNNSTTDVSSPSLGGQIPSLTANTVTTRPAQRQMNTPQQDDNMNSAIDSQIEEFLSSQDGFKAVRLLNQLSNTPIDITSVPHLEMDDVSVIPIPENIDTTKWSSSLDYMSALEDACSKSEPLNEANSIPSKLTSKMIKKYLSRLEKSLVADNSIREVMLVMNDLVKTHKNFDGKVQPLAKITATADEVEGAMRAALGMSEKEAVIYRRVDDGSSQDELLWFAYNEKEKRGALLTWFFDNNQNTYARHITSGQRMDLEVFFAKYPVLAKAFTGAVRKVSLLAALLVTGFIVFKYCSKSKEENSLTNINNQQTIDGENFENLQPSNLQPNQQYPIIVQIPSNVNDKWYYKVKIITTLTQGIPQSGFVSADKIKMDSKESGTITIDGKIIHFLLKPNLREEVQKINNLIERMNRVIYHGSILL